jgi:predicted HTH transcriptional regulator
MELQTVKAVAGFLNSEGGGTLAIGVSDQKEVLGLEPDYATFRDRRSRDGFEQFTVR